jgi:transposase
MLCPEYYTPRLSERDRWVFEAFVPRNHRLRKALEAIAWDDFYDELSGYYSPDQGQPAGSPVLMLKLEFLSYFHQLSDREVIARSETDLAFRYFLQIPQTEPLPEASSLSRFRGRLGSDGFRRVFDRLVGMARAHGLVKDRLRLKDASHVIADIAVPTALTLIAQIRDKLLAAAEPFDPLAVAGERIRIEMLRQQTDGGPAPQRLAARVTHLQDILAWVEQLPTPSDEEARDHWAVLQERRQLADKILYDQAHPDEGRRTVSTVDPEARRGKHGTWYDGYVVDLIMDADSELITQINVLPAGGDEAQDAVELIRREEAAHGNDVEALSIDGAGFHGPMLRELENAEGLGVNTFVPPKAERKTALFQPADFVQSPDHQHATCPAGQTSSYRQRNPRDTGWRYRFQQSTCAACPLISRCLPRMPRGPFGRNVDKNDYQAEYDRARAKATTEQFASVRREHPKVERKLGEILNRHGGRRARYRGQAKVMIQEALAATATNVKRIVHLLCAPTSAETASS